MTETQAAELGRFVVELILWCVAIWLYWEFVKWVARKTAEAAYRHQLEEVEAGYAEWETERAAGKYGDLDYDRLMRAVGREMGKPKLVKSDEEEEGAEEKAFMLDSDDQPKGAA